MAGRPKLDPKDRRNHTLRVRLNDDEHGAIAKAAEKSGVSMSEWVRSLVLDAAFVEQNGRRKPKHS